MFRLSARQFHIAIILAGCTLFMAFSATAAVRCVPSSFDVSCTATDADIQTAVNNASAGDTIFIDSGTFTENVNVDKRLIIQGSGAGTTIVAAAACDDPTIDLTAGGIDAANRLVIRDLTISGACGSPGNTSSGVRFLGAGAVGYTTFDSVTITGNTGDGIATDTGIVTVDVQILNSTLNGNGQDGINVNTSGPVDDLVIDNSSFDSNGIGGAFLEAVGGMTITNSTFNDNNGSGADHGLWARINDDSSGFLDDANNPVVIDNIQASNNARGVFFWIHGGSVTVRNSVIDNNNYDYSGTLEGWGLSLYATEDDTTILIEDVVATNNGKVNVLVTTNSPGNLASATIQRVTTSGSQNQTALDALAFCEGCGMWIRTRGAGTVGPVTITRNLIRDNIRGIYLDADIVPFGAVTISCNEFFGNTTTGLDDESDAAAPANAENNWWACNDGPGGVGCDTVTGSADFDPWLVLSTSAVPDSVSGGGTSTVTADFTTNSDDLVAPCLLADGVEVTFDAGVCGTFDPVVALTVDAQAISTFTANPGEGGADCEITATAGNQPVPILLAVSAIPTLSWIGVVLLLGVLALAGTLVLRPR